MTIFFAYQLHLSISQFYKWRLMLIYEFLKMTFKVIQRDGNFVEPTIISGLPHDSPVVLRETFAPIVYAIKASSLDEAIKFNNSVEQGLSSSVFTQNIGNIFQVFIINQCQSKIIRILGFYLG